MQFEVRVWDLSTAQRTLMFFLEYLAIINVINKQQFDAASAEVIFAGQGLVVCGVFHADGADLVHVIVIIERQIEEKLGISFRLFRPLWMNDQVLSLEDFIIKVAKRVEKLFLLLLVNPDGDNFEIIEEIIGKFSEWILVICGFLLIEEVS